MKEEFGVTSAGIQNIQDNAGKITEVLFRFLTKLANADLNFDKDAIKSEIKTELVEELVTSGFKEEIIERLSTLWRNQADASTITASPNPQESQDSSEESDNSETETAQNDVRHLRFLPSSCGEIARYGVEGMEESGDYQIDPDGPLGSGEPIEVFCDLAAKSTIIRPKNVAVSNLENRLQDGLHMTVVDRLDFGNYNANIEQMRTLAKQSSFCKQEVDVSCTNAPFVYNDLSHVTWSYSDGKNQSMPQDNIFCKCGNFEKQMLL